MMYYLLLHLISDYLFQSDNMVKLKKEHPFKGNLLHTGYYLSINSIGLGIWIITRQDWQGIWQLVLGMVILSLIHFLIDFIKTIITEKLAKSDQIQGSKSIFSSALLISVVDQMFHIALIWLVSTIFLIQDVVPTSRVVTFGVAFVFSTFVASFFIRSILDLLISTPKSEENTEFKKQQFGKWIGIIERCILFPAIIFGVYEAFIVVIGLKALARIEEGKKNSDYIIAGNLLSLFFVLLGYGIWVLF